MLRLNVRDKSMSMGTFMSKNDFACNRIDAVPIKYERVKTTKNNLSITIFLKFNIEIIHLFRFATTQPLLSWTFEDDLIKVKTFMEQSCKINTTLN